MWQELVSINNSFNKSFKIDDVVKYKDNEYCITGIGHTHVVCSIVKGWGNDVIFSKKQFLKIFGAKYEN